MIPDERKGGQRITRLRRASLALLIVSVALWAASLVFSVRHFGATATLAFGDGSAALYFGGDEAERNTRVLNNFVWPYFSGGAGVDWTKEGWGRWQCYGPATHLSAGSLSQRWENPTKLGFRWPGVSMAAGSLWYVGVPFWTPALVGALGVVAFMRRGPVGRNTCPSCRYNREGLAGDAACPECGVADTQQTTH